MSRDVTIQSKKIIFALHRTAGQGNRASALANSRKDLRSIHALIGKIQAVLSSVDENDYFRSV
jgi:predicted translin family RNA/ssDNA-binding protein